MTAFRRSVGCLVLLCALWGRSSNAQEYTYRSFTRGLGNLNVNCLIQDRSGYVWIGTENGLFRFDGTHYSKFGREQGLADGFLMALFEDSAGRVWAGTRDGLAVRQSNGSFAVVKYQGKPLLVHAGSALSSSPGGAILAAADDGLFALSTRNGGRTWDAANLLPKTQEVTSVLSDGNEAFFFGCGWGLCWGRGPARKRWGPAQGLPEDRWMVLLTLHTGDIWARGENHIAVLHPNATRFETKDLPGATFGPRIPTLAEDAFGNVVAGLRSSIAIYSDDRWKVVSEANGLGDGLIAAILADRDGTIWLGTSGRGLQSWIGYGEWEHWTRRQGLQDSSTWAILRDGSGRIWLGNSGGIAIRNSNEDHFHALTLPRASTLRLRSMAETKDGYIWAGTYDGVLTGVRGSDFQTRQLHFPPISRVFVDTRDRVWLTTDAGLFASTGVGSKRTFAPVRNAALETGEFEDLAQGSDGRLWAISDRNLYSFDGGTWTQIDIRQAHLGPHLGTVAVDRSGFVWLDSYEVGVVRMRIEANRVVEVHPVKLASNNIIFIGCDQRGRVWVGEDQGVEVFDEGSIRRFNQDNGLVWNDTNSHAFFADEDGSVWLGTSGGASHYFGANVAASAPPQPVFAKAEYGARDLLTRSQSFVPSFPWSQSSLNLDLASLTSRNPRAIKFRYRLVGLDKNWVETEDSEIHYSALGPRSYRIEAIAVDSSTGMHSPVRALDFQILPRWWETKAASAVGAAVLACFGVLIWKWRLRLIMNRQRELERLVSERTEELDRRLVEEAQLKADAERANRTKSEFLAMMSHEIRTPMNGVIGMASVLEQSAATTEQRDSLRIIRQSGMSLLAILNDILDFSKIEAGKLSLETIDFDLRELVNDAATLITEVARAKDVTLSVDFPTWIDSSFNGDPVRVRQVLLNLLSNAIKFTNEGSVGIRVTETDTQSPGRATMKLEVFDTGIGITPEASGRLFRSFSQAESSTSRQYGGTGLGLVISKRLTEMMGGEIGFESEPGSGSTFWFTLDLKRSEARVRGKVPLQTPTQNPRVSGGTRVLVTEDNLVNQRVAAQMLAQLGYQVDIAENGEVALRMVQEKDYKAILMDMQMPVMDGLAATQAIRNLGSSVAGIPVIALTANAAEEERQRCLRSGMDDYLSKPIDRETLARAMRRWTSSEEPAQDGRGQHGIAHNAQNRLCAPRATQRTSEFLS